MLNFPFSFVNLIISICFKKQRRSKKAVSALITDLGENGELIYTAFK